MRLPTAAGVAPPLTLGCRPSILAAPRYERLTTMDDSRSPCPTDGMKVLDVEGAEVGVLADVVVSTVNEPPRISAHRPRRHSARRLVGAGGRGDVDGGCCSACLCPPSSRPPTAPEFLAGRCRARQPGARHAPPRFVRVQDVVLAPQDHLMLPVSTPAPPPWRAFRLGFLSRRMTKKEDDFVPGATSTSSRCASRGSTSWTSPSSRSCTRPTSPTSSARSDRASAVPCWRRCTPVSPPTTAGDGARLRTAVLQEMLLARAAQVLEQTRPTRRPTPANS